MLGERVKRFKCLSEVRQRSELTGRLLPQAL